MSFGYPSFLWALLSLAIPIIIHLFNFRKTIRIYFSNTQFLKQVKEETTQKRKLKKYLVLASRLLFLFFLVLAFAQPFLPAREQMPTQQGIVIYLDNSLSMSAPVGEKKRALDEAIVMAQNLVDLFPAATRFKLITNDFEPYSNLFKTKAEVTDLLARVRLTGISRSASEIIHRLNGEEKVTLFWFSDFQKSTFGNAVATDSTWQIRLVPLTLEDYPNIFVDTAYLENPFVVSGERNTLKLVLRNNGKKDAQELVTKLVLNGIQSGATSVSIPAKGTSLISFDITSKLSGRKKAVFSFNDYPISFDNDFYCVLDFSVRLKIVEIKSEGNPTYIEKVFGNKEIFSFKSFTPSNLDYGMLANADMVVVHNFNQPDEALVAAIQSYQEKNGTLLLIPGENPDLGTYAQLTNTPMTKSAAKEANELSKPDFQNPIFANVFEETNVAITMPSARASLLWSDRSAVLQFKNGEPFLSQFNNTFILACPLDKKFTDFQTHALFVPVMYRVATSSKKNAQPLYYPLSASSVSVPSDSLTSETPVKMIGRQEVIPSQRNFNGQLQLELPNYSLTPGFYDVINSRDTLATLAFNLNKNESVLEQLKPEEAKNLLGGKTSISIFKPSDAQGFNTEAKERYFGTPLWKFALMASLLFLLAEVLLIRFLK
ncbi:MAG: BatA and WFA domain-containing protein [Bacteroidetes bacterium]|nr:BatA and WFA domain-containing protein [Bacteroidota bacterium]